MNDTNARRWITVALLSLWVTCGCHADEDSTGESAQNSPASQSQNEQQAFGGRVGVRSEPIATRPLSAGLRAAYIASRQRDGGARYAFSSQGGLPQATNPSNGWRVGLHDGAIQLEAADGAWALDVQLAALGRATVLEPAQPVTVADTTGSRLTLKRGAIDEWYVNGPLGLEQGWTLPTRPAGSGPLTLVVAFAGATPTTTKRGAVLRDELGTVLARYTDLYAEDADGQELTSWMEARGQRLLLHIDDQRARYPLQIDPLIWVQSSNLIMAADAANGDQFGYAVAISGDTAVVGAYGDGTTNFGSAYVLVYSGGNWVAQQKIVASNASNSSEFGQAVAIEGDTILVGAPGQTTNRGAAYVFTRSGTVWTEQQELVADVRDANDRFGEAVALAGDTALIAAEGDDDGASAAGAAYAFLRVGNSWSLQQKLVAADASANALFGEAVALEADTAVIGATGSAATHGALYVMVRAGGTWNLQQKLLGTEVDSNDVLGASVALSGDTLLAGADGSASGGAAYALLRTGTTWTLQQKLVPADLASGDRFGWWVAVDGDAAMITAPLNDDGASNSGSAYQFVRSGGSWTEQQKVIASSPVTNGLFGRGLAFNANHLLIGSPNVAAGLVYAFTLLSANGDPCSVGSECGSSHCVDGVCCENSCGAGAPDDCGVCNAAGTEGTCTNLPQGSTCGNLGESICDHPDTCSSAGLCLPNIDPNNTPCGNASSSECDNPDTCLNGLCVPNSLPSGTPCGDQNVICHFDDSCNGNGSCVDSGLWEPGADCGDQASECSIRQCDQGGNCGDLGPKPAGSACGSLAGSPCSAPDSCDGVGTCQTNHAVAGTECTPPGCTEQYFCAEGECVGSCPSGKYCNGSECASTLLRGEVCSFDLQCESGSCVEGVCCDTPCDDGCGSCTVPDSLGLCLPRESGFVCRNGVDQSCDATETCDGVSTVCPADAPLADGASCPGGECSDGVCFEDAPPILRCSCNAVGQRGGSRWWLLVAFAPLILRRRQRLERGARRPPC